ncbi:MAG: SpoIIIAH-like family protein [Clostridium sp.]|nr:SpoIIIAH-like family protein [Clostridium sp.]
MAIRKRQLVLAALVVALGAAVYLNWQFGGNSQIVDAGTSVSDKELGAAQLVNGSVDSSPSSAVLEVVSSAVSGGTASEVSSEIANIGANTDVNTYFAQARLERQKSRDASQELVQKVLDDTTADENTKTEAANQASEISQNIVTETNIENLVKSKGFVDCVAFIQNGACNVVVQKDGEFASADAIAIKDIVVAQAKISADKITIVSK